MCLCDYTLLALSLTLGSSVALTLTGIVLYKKQQLKKKLDEVLT